LLVGLEGDYNSYYCLFFYCMALVHVIMLIDFYDLGGILVFCICDVVQCHELTVCSWSEFGIKDFWYSDFFIGVIISIYSPLILYGTGEFCLL